MINPSTKQKWLDILSKYMIGGELSSDKLGTLLLYFLEEQINSDNPIYDEIVDALSDFKERYMDS